jgi:hypothetical protein
MNGLIDIVDGGGSEIVDGNITCKTLTTSTSITTPLLNATTSITTPLLTAYNLVITNLNISLAYITTLYVSAIRSNSLNPVVMDDTTYNSVSFADKCDCDINIGGSQYGTRINIGNKTDRISDINIGNGLAASGNVNIENGANSTGQVAIKQFIFIINNIRNTVFTNPLSLFTTQTGNITLSNGSISTSIATFIFSSNQIVTTLLSAVLNLIQI